MEMSAGEKVRTIMNRQGMSMGEMADKTGQSRQNLSNKMKRDNFTMSDLEKMADAMGLRVRVQFVDAEGNIVL